MRTRNMKVTVWPLNHDEQSLDPCVDQCSPSTWTMLVSKLCSFVRLKTAVQGRNAHCRIARVKDAAVIPYLTDARHMWTFQAVGQPHFAAISQEVRLFRTLFNRPMKLVTGKSGWRFAVQLEQNPGRLLQSSRQKDWRQLTAAQQQFEEDYDRNIQRKQKFIL